MSKEIVVNVGERETRIAVMEDGRLAELHIEREERVVGSLYKARVENVLPGMDASFVDVGLSRNAFLYVGDVLPTSDSGASNGASPADESDERDEDEGDGGDEETDPGAAKTRARPRSIRRSVLRQQKISDVLRIGQELLVQVTKGPRGTKGARVSTRISLPGRYIVLMPEADNIGVSRKIEDNKERDRLKRIGEKMREPGFGIIIRTEAEDKTEAELMADRDFLLKLWRQVQETSRKVRAPAMVHQDLTLVYKTIRDIFGSDVGRLTIDDATEYEKANELLEMVSPKLRGRIHLYSSAVPIFDHFNIEAEIEKTLKRKVWLRSGGYLIFDETEALTVIDVNTGKFVGGSNLSETIVKTNLDAASEIARQLRLRDIGGIIVIDFIDMNQARDRQHVAKSLEAALKRDRARTKISSVSPLGLIEMTRKRTAETIVDFMTQPCEYCGGRGKVPSAETIALAIEQELRRTVATDRKNREALLVVCHPDVAETLVGIDGDTASKLEQELMRAVYIRGDATLHIEKHSVSWGEITELDKRWSSHKRSTILECDVIRSAVHPEPAVVGWADGYMVELNDGKKLVGQRVRARLTDVRRSFGQATILGSVSA